MDLKVAIAWIIVSVITTVLCIFGWVLLSQTPSRKNGIHAFLASLLTSRVIFCLCVTPVVVFHVFMAADWSVLGCHAVYWLWTVTWVSDIIAVCAALSWGLVKLGHMHSTFRLGSTIAISGVWLLSTTSAGILAYFNKRIKDKPALKKHGCDVMPNLSETPLTIGLFSILSIGVIISTALLISFRIALSFKIKKSAVHNTATSSNGSVVSHITVNAQTVNGLLNGGHGVITREPSRLEDIEEYRCRRGANSPLVTEDEQKKLADWRKLLCTCFTLMLLLDVLPHMVLLAFLVLRDYRVPYSDVILVSCQLANSFLLPIAMVAVSMEYKQTVVRIFRGESDDDPGSQRPSPNPQNRLNRSNDTVIVTVDRPATSDSQQQPQQQHQQQQAGSSNPAFVVTGPDSCRQSPNVVRSESHLSRLEWKERMIKSAKLPVPESTIPGVSGYEVPEEADMNYGSGVKLSVGKSTEDVSYQGSVDTDSGSVSGVSGGFNDSDIDRVLDTPIPRVSLVKSNKGKSDTDSISGSESGKLKLKIRPTISRVPHVRHSKQRRRKETSDRRAQNIYATINRALGIDEEDQSYNGHRSPQSGSRFNMVYSPNNPFLQTLPEETEVDTESEQSVEAEIIAITIRGRCSLRRKLKKRGLLPGLTYVTNGNDLPNYNVNSNIQGQGSNGGPIHEQQISLDNIEEVDGGESTSMPFTRTTNPFINIMSDGHGLKSRKNTNIFNGMVTNMAAADYTREWVENEQKFQAYDPAPHHSNPFLNYGYESAKDDHDTQSNNKRWSSNPFLQDIGSGENHLQFSHLEVQAEDEFVTKSAPTSPKPGKTTKATKPGALVVTIGELLKSKSEGLATYDTGQKHDVRNGSFGRKPVQPEGYVTEYL